MTDLHLYFSHAQHNICLQTATVDQQTAALPLLLYVPFLQNLPLDFSFISTALYHFRAAQQPHKYKFHSTMETDDIEIGTLTQQDIEYLKTHSTFSIDSQEAMPRIRHWLDQLLTSLPQWSHIGEIWFQALSNLLRNSLQPAYFQLDLAPLFSVGENFEGRLKSAFQLQHLLKPRHYERAAFILQTETISSDLMHIYHDLNAQSKLLTQVDRVEELLNLPIHHQENTQIHALREYLLQGDWETFQHHIQVQNSREMALITQAAYVATHWAKDEGHKALIQSEKQQLWLQSHLPVYQAKAYSEQMSLARQHREQNRFAEAALQYEKALALFPDAIHQKSLKQDYVSALLNLSYLYIILMDEPQRAFALLHPVLQVIDTDETWLGIHSKDRGKIKANYESALVKMRNQEQVMPEHAPAGLSKENSLFLSAQKNRWLDLIDENAYTQSLQLCEQSIELLQQNHIPGNSYLPISWHINKAQSLRHLQRYSESEQVLNEVIELINQTENMHAKQLLPRAQLGLGLNAKRQGQIEKAKMIYNQIIHSPYRNEVSNDISRSVGDACNNLGLIFAEEENHENASYHYQKSCEYYLTADDPVKASEKLWFAYAESKLTKDWQRQHTVVEHFIQTFQDFNHEKIVMRMEKIQNAKIELDKSNPATQSIFKQLFSKWF